jgi:enamine deaminase RidA (YjgF/YER057c/UK114 family)
VIDRSWPKDVYVREVPGRDQKVYAQVVQATGSRHVHVAGCLPFDEHNNFVGDGDITAQTAMVMQAIGRSLTAFGAGPQDVVRTKTYVIDIDDYIRAGHQVWLEFFGEQLPVSTLVQVVRLADPRALVEIEAYAVLD